MDRESPNVNHVFFAHLLDLLLVVLFWSPPISFSIKLETKASLHPIKPILSDISVPIKYTNASPPYISSQKFFLQLNITNPFRIIPVDVPQWMDYTKPKDVINISRNETGSLYEYESQFILRNCAFGDSTTFFISTICHIIPKYTETVSRANFTGEFGTVLLICMTYTDFFGHFFIDTIDFLTILPPQLYQSSFFPVYTFKPFMVDLLSIFGIPKTHIVPISPNHFIFARKLIAFVPAPCYTHSPYLSLRLREFLKSRLDLDKVKPFRFVIMNRKKEARRFVNFGEVCDSIEKNFSKVKWERVNDAIDLKDSVMFFNSVKLLVGVHGSQMANAIFMQSGTCVCEVHYQYVNINFICLMAAIGLNYMFSCMTEFFYEFPTVELLPTEVTNRLVKRAFLILGMK